MAIDPKHDPHAHFVVKPLPSQVGKGSGDGAGAVSAGAAGAGRGSAAGVAGIPGARAAGAVAAQSDDPFLRAANEDDDGYDPYSDRPAEREPLFQEDPWA